MSKYIERDELYDQMNATGAEFDLIDALEMIENFPAADVVPAAQWIPTTERLPEKWIDDAGMVNYMIYSPDFGVDIGCYHAEAKKWLCMALPCTVTHWMPLPEPPEEGNDGDK